MHVFQTMKRVGETHMTDNKIKARLNLNAVMRNLEELPSLDKEAADIIRDWSLSIRFTIRGDISAYLSFSGGKCKYDTETTATADVSLFFVSPGHLNAMFDNKAMPIPVRGFSKLRFLKNEFPKITNRLEYFLKPEDSLLKNPEYVRVNTALSLYTAAFSICELVQLDPISKLVGDHTPTGTLQLNVLPDGPYAYVVYDGKGCVTAFRGQATNPMASISFRDCQTANQLFNGKLDGFSAIALGDLKLKGLIPLIDNTNLILDRIPLYLQ